MAIDERRQRGFEFDLRNFDRDGGRSRRARHENMASRNVPGPRSPALVTCTMNGFFECRRWQWRALRVVPMAQRDHASEQDENDNGY